jgi:polyisoprenoid-binding protein YceI
MNRFILLWSLVLGNWSLATAQTFITQAGETSFFSETPVENISATNKKVRSAINPATGDVVVTMQMTDFQFPNKLMQEHFNENYVESEKYPAATFRGRLTEPVDFTKAGTYDVVAKGSFTLHGVSQERTLKGKLTVEPGQKLTLLSDFSVALKDHAIEVPTLVFVKVAQVISVKNRYVYAPFTKQ